MSPEPLATGARSAARTAVAVLLALGALAYTTWALEAFLPTGLSPLRTYVSELAAEDQPYGTFFRSLDFGAGVLVCAGAVLALLRRTRPAGLSRGLALLSTLGWAGVAVFGAATAADSRLPLSCAPTADAACAARERAGLVPAAHSAHAVSSSVAVAGALVGMVLLTVVVRRAGARGGGPAGGLLTVLLGVELAATVWTLAAVAAFDAGRGNWGLGVAQRLQLLTIAVWLVVVAWLVRRSGPRG
ncbi:DUF998 domain-containing protein [Streptomyces sp. NPDC127108]|uniref:DUF998 domain-containing protein n=1 Tax=Streptomyces sp. NPDC127108 TaxID=3345361 RepID=UPI003645D4BD